jgi:hypothetical protein
MRDPGLRAAAGMRGNLATGLAVEQEYAHSNNLRWPSGKAHRIRHRKSTARNINGLLAIECQNLDSVGEDGFRTGNRPLCFPLGKSDSCGSNLKIVQTEGVGDSDANMLATCRYAQGFANGRIIEGQVGLVLKLRLVIHLPKIDLPYAGDLQMVVAACCHALSIGA